MTDPADPADPASSTPAVIVGVDGSDGATAALAWARHKSELLGSVAPVWVYEHPTTLDMLVTPIRRIDAAELRAAREEPIVAGIAAAAPDLVDRTRVIEGHAGVELVRAARDARLLVVGSRGRSPVVATLLGSVSSYCVKNAAVPVAVIPPGFPTDRPLSTIVVGVDGSPNAERALQWAIEHVEPTGTVYAIGALSMWGYMAGEFDPPTDVLAKQLEQTVELAVQNAIDLVGDRLPHGPQVIIQVVTRDARVALPQLAGSKADALVIGARGTTGMGHLLLGSVSTALVHHPVVPTVVIPRDPADTASMPTRPTPPQQEG